MKLSKVLLSSAVLAVAALGFVGCGENIGADIIKGSGKNYSIDYDNTASDSIARDTKFLTTKHNDSDVTITFEEQTNGSDANAAGQMGFVFAKEENDDGSINFCVVSFRKTSANSTGWDWYVSAFRNIDASTLATASNFGAPTTPAASDDAFLAATTPIERVIDSKKLGTALNGVTAGEANGAGSILLAIDQDTKTDSTTFGDYTINVYNVSDTEKATSLANAKVSARVAGIDTAEDNTAGKIQRNIGVYTNVYAKSYLKGTWKLSEITGEAVVEE